MKHCRVCRALLAEHETVCPSCGAIQHPAPATSANPGGPAVVDGGATMFGGTGEQHVPSGEVIVVQSPSASKPSESRAWTVVLACIGAAILVTATVLITFFVKKGWPPRESTTTTTTPAPISDVRITYPPNGANINTKFPLVVKVSIVGDESKVEGVDFLVDGKTASTRPGTNKGEYIVAVQSIGRHSVVARAKYAGGEKSSKPIEVVRS